MHAIRQCGTSGPSSRLKAFLSPGSPGRVSVPSPSMRGKQVELSLRPTGTLTITRTKPLQNPYVFSNANSISAYPPGTCVLSRARVVGLPDRRCVTENEHVLSTFRHQNRGEAVPLLRNQTKTRPFPDRKWGMAAPVAMREFNALLYSLGKPWTQMDKSGQDTVQTCEIPEQNSENGQKWTPAGVVGTSLRRRPLCARRYPTSYRTIERIRTIS